MSKTPSARLKTPIGVVSYPHLFEAVAAEEGQKKKFSVTLVFDRAGQTSPEFKAMQEAAKAAATGKFGADAVGWFASGKLRSPFRKDAADKGYPEGTIFVNLRSDTAPGVVSRYKGADGKPLTITKDQQVPGNAEEVYPGCQGRATVSCFAYDRAGNKGVSFGLSNFQKTDEGSRIDNRKAAKDEFEADLTEVPADLPGEEEAVI